MAQTKAIFVLGIKWRDKVNGNTYNRPVIFLDNGDRISGDFGYGYGDCYYWDAQKICAEQGIKWNNPPHTDKYATKAEAKDERYF